MAKFKPLVSLDVKVNQSDIVGILDLNDNDELIITVDDAEYKFDDIKHLFVGGTIEMHSLFPIEE